MLSPIRSKSAPPSKRINDQVSFNKKQGQSKQLCPIKIDQLPPKTFSPAQAQSPGLTSSTNTPITTLPKPKLQDRATSPTRPQSPPLQYEIDKTKNQIRYERKMNGHRLCFSFVLEPRINDHLITEYDFIERIFDPGQTTILKGIKSFNWPIWDDIRAAGLTPKITDAPKLSFAPDQCIAKIEGDISSIKRGFFEKSHPFHLCLDKDRKTIIAVKSAWEEEQAIVRKYPDAFKSERWLGWCKYDGIF